MKSIYIKNFDYYEVLIVDNMIVMVMNSQPLH